MVFKIRLQVFIVGLLLSIPACCFASEFDAKRTQVEALGALTEAPACMVAEGFESDEKLKAIYFDALPWQGRDTKVFAWLGMPENVVGNQQVPGIVLVHGGGGTAFKNWVQEWNKRGFAAISIAVEGQTDVRDDSKAWQQHVWAGPQRVGIYGDSAKPLEEQWMYHAVADTVLANSLLRSLPNVDAEKVGLMGISWGGVIASTVVGIDSRFAFAIPTYGCGHLADAENQYGRALGGNDLYRDVWDPMQRLSNATMPMLWFSWPQDSHFPLDCQAESYRAAGGTTMVSLVPGMGHGHGPPWNRPESYAFAESIVMTGVPWCIQMDASVADEQFCVVFSSQRKIDEAVLIWTSDEGVTGSRNWVESPAELQRQSERQLQGEVWTVTSSIPPSATAYFINVRSGGCVVSSQYQEIHQ